MRYYRYLYLTEGLEKKKKRIIQKLEKKQFQINMYLILLSESAGHQLEIINSLLFQQKNYPAENYFVIGLAKSHEDALEIVEKITQEVYDKTRGTDIRSYILKREQDG